jgi:signal transduction histidine kinase
LVTDRSAARIGELCRLLLAFRLLALLVTIIYIPLRGGEAPILSVALVVAALASYMALRYWTRLEPHLLRHPSILAADLVLALSVLLLAGPQSPFLYYTLAITAIAGVAYSWPGAAFFSVLGLAGYAGVLALRDSAGAPAEGFQELFGLPALYPVTAVAGAALRRVVERQARVEEGLAAAALTAATSEERSRVAREMHDSLAKTLHGISLTATALAKRVERDPAAAAADARVLSDASERAAEEARELITDLRADQLESSLEDAVREYAASWSRATGTPVSVDADGVQARSPAVRYELFRILREALENVRRHARARSVRVQLESPGGGLRLSVSDDGVGTRTGHDLSELEPAGHFGLIGIAERARRLGGSAELAGAPGRGTTVIVTVPAEDGAQRPQPTVGGP